MLRIISVLKEGNRIKGYKVENGAGQQALITRDEMSKHIRQGNVKNARIQMYQGREIIRVQDDVTTAQIEKANTQPAKPSVSTNKATNKVESKKTTSRQARIDKLIKAFKVRILMGAAKQISDGMYVMQTGNKLMLFIDDKVKSARNLVRTIKDGMNGGYNYLGDVIKKVVIMGGKGIEDACTMLAHFNIALDITMLDTSNVTNMVDMFRQTHMSKVKGIEDINTHNVRDMSNMFLGANIADLDLSRWNIANVATMQNLFRCAEIKGNIDISTWNPGSSCNIQNMLMGAGYDKMLRGEKVNSIVDMRSMMIKGRNVNGMLHTTVYGPNTVEVILGSNNIGARELQDSIGLNESVRDPKAKEIMERTIKENVTKHSDGTVHIKLWANRMVQAGSNGESKINLGKGKYCIMKVQGNEKIIHIPDDVIRFPYAAETMRTIIAKGDKVKITGGKNLISMGRLFKRVWCDELDLTGMDTGNVQKMSYLFWSVRAKTIRINGLNLRSLVDKHCMFKDTGVETICMSKGCGLTEGTELSSKINVVEV